MTFLVDASMYEAHNALPRDVYGDLDTVVRTDLHYHYSTPVCAHRWLAVCDDEAYGHRALLDRVEGALPPLVDALRVDRGTGRGAGTAPLTFVSLGPGDGALDERMLRALDARMDIKRYVGLDFSFELLRRATHRLTRAQGWRRPFPVQAVCGDFNGIDASALGFNGIGDARLFALTGFTIGNYGEDALLAHIRELMRPGDYLLVDARLHALGPLPASRALTPAERQSMLDGYDLKSVREFVFGPVEVATTATAADVTFRFDVDRAPTTVPNALRIVIACEGLDTTMRLTGEHVRRAVLDLAVTTKYHAPDLHAWIASAGFGTVWQDDIGGVGLFLLKRQ